MHYDKMISVTCCLYYLFGIMFDNDIVRLHISITKMHVNILHYGGHLFPTSAYQNDSFLFSLHGLHAYSITVFFSPPLLDLVGPSFIIYLLKAKTRLHHNNRISSS